MKRSKMAVPTTQDLIDAIDNLREAVESLEGEVKTLNESVGDLFNAFDPKYGESLHQILDAADRLIAALKKGPPGGGNKKR